MKPKVKLKRQRKIKLTEVEEEIDETPNLKMMLWIKKDLVRRIEDLEPKSLTRQEKIRQILDLATK